MWRELSDRSIQRKGKTCYCIFFPGEYHKHAKSRVGGCSKEWLFF